MLHGNAVHGAPGRPGGTSAFTVAASAAVPRDGAVRCCRTSLRLEILPSSSDHDPPQSVLLPSKKKLMSRRRKWRSEPVKRASVTGSGVRDLAKENTEQGNRDRAQYAEGECRQSACASSLHPSHCHSVPDERCRPRAARCDVPKRQRVRTPSVYDSPRHLGDRKRYASPSSFSVRIRPSLPDRFHRGIGY